MNRLTDLHPEFIGCLRPGPASGEGVTFDCPACGPKHRLVAYFSNPLDGQPPNGWTPKWERDGTEFSALTVGPSLQYGCWHGWVEGGMVWDVHESPLIVPGVTLGRRDIPFVSLSPKQAEELCRDVLDRVAKMRRQGFAAVSSDGAPKSASEPR